MTGTLLFQPVIRAVDPTGAPISGAQLQFYETGTTTPETVYADSGLTTPLANPVVADSGGLFVPIFLNPAITYRVELLDGSGTLILNMDPVNAPAQIANGAVTAAMLASGAAAGNLGFTPLNKAGDTATNLAISPTTPASTSAGYLGVPVNEQDGAYGFLLSDAGKMVRGNPSTAIAWTIPPNASVAFPLGTAIVVRNVGAGTITLTRGAGVTLWIAGSGTSKDVALAQWGLATLVQEAANAWVVSGVGVS
ncbi:MAG: hypothetical protein KGL69_11075 [Alphaproteobacteria bacterium]|nr:hypothetical protein [Alphaproteobacteria bacterium]